MTLILVSIYLFLYPIYKRIQHGTRSGVYDNSLRERMLMDSALTLATAIEAGHAAEETKKHAHELHRQTPSEVNRIEPKFNISRDSQKEADVAKINHKKVERNKANSSKHDYRDDFFENCKFCAGAHKRGNCPAYGKKCRKCKKKNHFEACCSQEYQRRESRAGLDKFIRL